MNFAQAATKEWNATQTTNGLPAHRSTLNNCLDLFFKIGASRNKDLTSVWAAALKENEELAMRVMLWGRDCRGGAGERETPRKLIEWLKQYRPTLLTEGLFAKLVELGRWDDVMQIDTPQAIEFVCKALLAGDRLCAKWAPRKGPLAVKLTKALNMSPKQYRKLLVGLTNVVENKMCAKQWSEINYEHVPSVAMSRYMKAFSRNDATRFGQYRMALVAGAAKINAKAVFPHDILRAMLNGADEAVCDAQWKALPDLLMDNNVLPICDTSGSMTAHMSGSIRAIEICLGLGIYCAQHNRGAFEGLWMTFSARPQFQRINKGHTLKQVWNSMIKAEWAMNTNFHAALQEILRVAVEGRVAQEDMPNTLLILSDMQFDAAHYRTLPANNAMGLIEQEYAAAGYEAPKVVFWNLNSHDNVPVTFNKQGVALVSGYSPNVLKNVLKGTVTDPMSMMFETVGGNRYDYGTK